MSERGHHVTVVYTRPPWEQFEVPGELPYELRWAAFPDLRSRRAAPLRALAAYAALREVRALLSPGEPAVIHSHGEEGGLLHRLRREYPVRIVSTAHYPWYPSGMCSGRGRGLVRDAWLWARQSKFVMQGRASRQADLCCVPSAYAACLMQSALGVHPGRIRVVHNGVPAEFLSVERKRVPADGPLVFFGRFDRTKGVHVLLDALSLAGSAAPPALIIGDGPERGAYESRIQALGLTGRVRLLPWLGHCELAGILRGALLCALPSLEENFSLAVLSAMAVGVATISTPVGGTPEMMEDGVSGLLVPAECPDALAAAIRRLGCDHALNERIGRAARERVLAQFTWAEAARKMEAHYEELLQGAEHDVSTWVDG